MPSSNSSLLDGLGQLTDGVLARDDYLLSENVQGIGQLGYDWIGWKRKPSPNFTISLQFYFDTIRQFNSISIHASNLFTRDISLFSSVTITNCDDPTQRIEKTIPEDRTSIQARFVNISLGSAEEIRGTCLRTTFSFHPRSRWILLSEVLIDSRPIVTYHPRFTTPILNRHGPPSSGKIEVICRMVSWDEILDSCRKWRVDWPILALVADGLQSAGHSDRSLDLCLHPMDSSISPETAYSQVISSTARVRWDRNSSVA